MKYRIFLLALLGSMSPNIAPPAAAAEGGEKPYRLADFTEPFQDPDGTTVAAFATAEQVDLNEAKKRLSAINRLNAFAYKLQSRYPDSVAGFSVKSGSTVEANLILTKSSNLGVQDEVKSLTYLIPSDVNIKTSFADKSLKMLHEEASSLVLKLKQSGVDAVVASNSTTSLHRVMATDPDEVLRQLVVGKFRLSVGTSIEYSGGVKLTATEVYGGTKVENNNRFDNPSSCTLGFNVGQVSGSLRGQSTAAHCVNNLRNSHYNKPLGFQQEWASGGVDSQWHTFLGGADYLIVGKVFPNSNIAMNVTGGQAVSPGSYICKYGITTNVTCGYVDTVTITDSYGTFPRLLTNSTYPIQSLEGDSGGPVYAGSLAVGMTHARMANSPYHNVFTPLTAWSARNLPIGIIACC